MLITEWRRLGLPTDATLVVAVSGGADSLSLLLAVTDLVRRGKLSTRIVAAHFNHRLRGSESEADEDLVRAITKRLRVELALGHSKGTAAGNLEQNARVARYEFLAATARNVGAAAVLTGHTMNDQAETFLLNLIRGSGPDGLAAMRPVREFPEAGCLLVRPMMTWARRRATEGFCLDMGVEYCSDTMNEDTAFRRVRIRKVLLPLLEDMNPSIVETLCDTARLIQNIPPASERDVAAFEADEPRLEDVRALSGPELYAGLRQWLTKKRGNRRRLGLKNLQAIERLVTSEKSGKVVELPGGAVVVRSGGRLCYREN